MLTHDGEGRLRLVWRLLLFFILALTVGVVVRMVVPIPGVTGGSLAMLAGSLVSGWVVLVLDGRGPGALGFHVARSVPREVAQGGLMGVGVALLVVAVMGGLGGVRWAFEAGTLSGWLAGAWAAGVYLALPAAAEEALLRGYPLQALAERWGPGWALLLTSAVFGAMHRANPGATFLGTANTAAAGLFLGGVYLRTGSLWWATGVHLGWNWGLGYLADLPVSGLDVADAPWLAPVGAGPAWLGGGAFGPEGSVVATAVFVAAAAACWWGPWLRTEPEARARRPLALINDKERGP